MVFFVENRERGEIRPGPMLTSKEGEQYYMGVNGISCLLSLSLRQNKNKVGVVTRGAKGSPAGDTAWNTIGSWVKFISSHNQLCYPP